MDNVRPAAIRRDWDRFRVAGKLFDAIRLDQRIDDESAAGLALTIAAMTAVDNIGFDRSRYGAPQAQPPSSSRIGSSVLRSMDQK